MQAKPTQSHPTHRHAVLLAQMLRAVQPKSGNSKRAQKGMTAWPLRTETAPDNPFMTQEDGLQFSTEAGVEKLEKPVSLPKGGSLASISPWRP